MNTLGVELLSGESLGVQIIGDRDILFSSPEPGPSITYCKDGLTPALFAIDGINHSSNVRFWSKAWKTVTKLVRWAG